MKYLASLMLVLFVTNLYSMDTEKLDHQRTPKERALRVERINTYFKEIIENEDTLNSYKKVSKELEYAKKIANISLTYLDIFKKDLNSIENLLFPLEKDFKSLFASNDIKMNQFKEALQSFYQHNYEESSSLALEGCTSQEVNITLPTNLGNFVSVKIQCLKYSDIYFEAFKKVAEGWQKLDDKKSFLSCLKGELNSLHSHNSGQIKKIDSYLTWNNSQIETLKANRKEKIRLMHTNLDWFDVD